MSRNHVKLDRRRWARARRAALERAGYRSELSGHPGRLEVDHRVPLDQGGDPYDLSNLQVLTRREHIEKTRRENVKIPGRVEWLDMVRNLSRKGVV